MTAKRLFGTNGVRGIIGSDMTPALALSIGLALAKDPAIDAVKQWKYEPVIVEGKAVGVVFTVTMRFALK